MQKFFERFDHNPGKDGWLQEHEQEPSQDENVESISSEELTPMISCNAMAGINTPQTLKI